MASKRLPNLAVIVFLLGIVGLVFIQIETSMKEQGIASGGPYDNAASYPRAVAILVCILLCLQAVAGLFAKPSTAEEGEAPERSDLIRSGMMLAVFAAYLMVLTTVGYHLATTPMIFAIMWICGARQYIRMAVVSLAIAFGFAFAFEEFLNIVLPLGIWNIFIPW